MKTIENQTFDEERALYGSKNVILHNCTFDGAADGESALKESADIGVHNCFFNLRYPFWHDSDLKITGSEMTELCRAALWYSKNITVTDTKLHGIKALRECSNVSMENCDIVSPEFGWSVNGIIMKNCNAVSEYFMMRSSGLRFSHVHFKGKYSFQYIENAVFDNCEFETKDAFWHGKNITVRSSTIKGEYLAWYSENLTLENCTITGTQPFCYCSDLKLINCRMVDTDLCFEKSKVNASILTPVISIKNPRTGIIYVPEVGELIFDNAEAQGKVIVCDLHNCKGSTD